MTSLYGIIDARELAGTVTTITENNLAEAMRFYLDLYNGAVTQLVADYANRTTLATERFYLPTEAGEMEPSDEYSRGIMVRRPSPTYYDVAYPIKSVDARLGWTQLFLAKATGTRVQEDFDAVQQKDKRTMLKDVLRALLYKTNYTWDDDEAGTLTIRRLLNADGTIPPPVGTKTFDGNHTHYAGTNSAFNAAFMAVVYEHLREHGHGGNVIVEIARNLVSTVEGMTGFVPASKTFDARRNYPAGSTSAPITSTVTSPRAIGRIENMEIRVHDHFPDNYGFATDLSSPPPLAMREDAEATLNGLRLVQDTPIDNYPLRNAFFQRRVGFGTRNRSNGFCFQVVGSSTYTSPSI